MKVLHYISAFSLPSETFIYDLINGLQGQTDIDNYVLTHNRYLEDERPFENTFTVGGTPRNLLKRVLYKVIRRVFYKTTRRGERFRIRSAPKVYEIIQQLKPDVIHSHFGPNGIRMNNLLRQYCLNIPQIVSFHGMDVNMLPHSEAGYLNAMLSLGRQDSVCFTAPSQFLKKKMATLGVDEAKITIVHNSFNPRFAAMPKRSYFKKGETFKILNVGRLESVKGQRYLIRALAKVLVHYPDTHLSIVGDGSSKQLLINEAVALNILDRVSFLGRVPHSEIPDILMSHDLYVQPSIINERLEEENSPISVLEALASGMPVVASRIGGLPELVREDRGFLFQQENVDDLCEKITCFVDNPSELKVMGQNAHRLVMQEYTQEDQVNSTREIYERLTSWQ